MTRNIGFDNFALAQYVDVKPNDQRGMREYVALSDYPPIWREFVFDGKYRGNPVRRCTYATALGFSWESIGKFIPLTQDDRDIVSSWSEYGIGDGYTIGSHLPGEPSGSCSFTTRPGRALPQHNLALAHLIGCFAFQAARDMVTRHAGERPVASLLTQRQLECIVLVGRGKTDWEIARILGISEETVKQHLKDARTRYDVSKRVQLVIRVVNEGLISLHDLT